MASTRAVLATPAVACQAGAGCGELFRYHGWLSPAVCLFRRISLPVKAMCVLLCFLVPAVFLLFKAGSGAHDRIVTIAAEQRHLA